MLKAFLLLMAIGMIRSADPEDILSTTCKPALMDSFDLEGQSEPDGTTVNHLCAGIPVQRNCCSYQAQLQIYKKWIVSGERDKMLSFYKEFAAVYTEIFETFARVEEIAANTADITQDVPSSNCNKLANSVLLVKASQLQKVVVDAAEKAYDFLGESRSSFYCTLCDTQTHAYYNINQNTIRASQGFCGEMVENTLNYFLFKYQYFMKISRLYGQLMVNCDLRGIYDRDRFMKYDV